MRPKKKAVPRKGAKPPVLERWTIERLDRDAGMARVEKVPMVKSRMTMDMLDTLATSGVTPGMDNIRFWDVKRLRIQRMPAVKLASLFGARDDEKDTLSENMVFWVVRTPGRGAPEQIYHATRAARDSVKHLYRQVVKHQGGPHD
jgi:hypothetical protein